MVLSVMLGSCDQPVISQIIGTFSVSLSESAKVVAVHRTPNAFGVEALSCSHDCCQLRPSLEV